MYSYIKGKIIEQEDDFLVVENNGIGYEIISTMNIINRFTKDDEICVFTSFVIRENMQALYGFPTRAEVKLFKLLLTVSGIGPKLALQILDSFTPDKFATAVLTSNISSLTKTKGLGKKGAERLVLELKDKIKQSDLLISSTPNVELHSESDNEQQLGLYQDCISALIVLGYTPQQAEQVMGKSFDEKLDIEENIRMALRVLAR